MDTIRLTRGDTGNLDIQLVEGPLGTPRALSATDVVVLRMAHRTLPDVAFVKQCTIVDASSGRVAALFGGEDLYLPAGVYDASVDVMTQGGVVTSTGRFTVELEEVVASNWLQNPSFEDYLAGWVTNPDAYHEVTTTTSDAYHGGVALRVVRQATTGRRELVWQDIVVAPASRPQLSDLVVASCYVLPVSVDAGLSVLLGLRAEKRDGAVVASAETTVAADSGSWSRASVSLQLPAVAHHVRVLIACDSAGPAGGEILFDAFQLEPGQRATPFRT